MPACGSIASAPACIPFGGDVLGGPAGSPEVGRIGTWTPLAGQRADALKQESYAVAVGRPRAVADASTLVLPEIGLLRQPTRPSCERSITERKLLRNGIVLRYDQADDFGTPTSASWSAPSGTSTRWRASAGATRRARCSNARWPGATMSACCRRTSHPRHRRSCGAISRRPIRRSG